MATQVKVHADMSFATRKFLWSLRGLSRAALGRIADLVEGEAKRRAPVRTGTLRDSIKGKVRKAYKGDGLIATVTANTKGKWKVVTRKNGQPILAKDGRPLRKMEKFGYSKLVELGAYDGRPYTSTPFLRPAVLENIEGIRRIYKEEAAKAAREHNRSNTPVASYANVEIPIYERDIKTGKRGGRYYLTDSGRRVYVKK